MKWVTKDVTVFLQAKEYVDTAVVPLLPITLGGQMKQAVEMGEFCMMLTRQLEKQLHGRIFLMPSFTYLQSEPVEERLSRLQMWLRELKNHFDHLFLITSDSDWKRIENQLGNTLIWLPAIPFEHMDEKYQREILSDQTKQLLQIVTKKWQFES